MLNKITVKKLIASGLEKIVISLDGSNNEINSIIRGNSFDEAINGLKNLNNSPIYKIISFTIHEKNKDDFENILKIALKYNINEVRVGALLLCGKGEKLSKLTMNEKSMQKFYHRYEEIRKKYTKVKTRLAYPGYMKNKINIEDKKICYVSCDAGLGQLAIGPVGEVYSCYNLVNEKNFIIGNIKKYNFFKEIDMKKLTKLRLKCPILASGHLYLGDI